MSPLVRYSSSSSWICVFFLMISEPPMPPPIDFSVPDSVNYFFYILKDMKENNLLGSSLIRSTRAISCPLFAFLISIFSFLPDPSKDTPDPSCLYLPYGSFLLLTRYTSFCSILLLYIENRSREK